MGNPKNIIEINGNRYDALTGKMLDNNHSTPTQATGKNVDGFVRRKPHKQSHHPPTATHVHAKPQHAKTLMRGAVKKPAKRPAGSSIQPRVTPLMVTPEPVIIPTDTSRFARAKKISKNALVSRFGSKTQTTELVTTETTQHKIKKTTPKALSPTDHNKTQLQKSLNQAVADARSHEQPEHKAPKKRRKVADRLHISPRALNTSLFLVAFVFVGSFIAYQNIPNLSMRLASARSGVHGSLPGYQPGGFSLNGPIYYQPGQITLSYKSNSDDRNFNVIQKNSSWDSNTLLEKHVKANNQQSVSYQADGKTIFIYNGSNASWIEDGVWYEVQGSSALTKDQLIKIANSL